MVTDSHDVDPAAWKRRRPAAVVKMLALADQHRLHVDAITDALWPRLGAESARQNLHNALYHARRALQPSLASGETPRWLAYDSSAVSLNPGPGLLTVDVALFEAAARAALASRNPSDLEHALSLHGPGGLLPEDRYEEWVAPRADALQALHIELLIALSEAHQGLGAHEPAIAALTRAISIDPYGEGAQARLIRAYTAAGQRHLALRQHQRFAALLTREFGGFPGPDVQAAYREAQARSTPAERGEQDPAPAAVGNLPSPLSRFVGRGGDVEAIARLLGQERLVTLSGSGGVGKTRLAVEVARTVRGSFADGVWFADFGELTNPELVPQVIARSLGVTESRGQHLGESILAALEHRQLLLILDTCEHVCAELAAQIVALLGRCPSLSVLCASRQTLQVAGETVYWVPALGLPGRERTDSGEAAAMGEAVELFCDRARAFRPSFEVTPENAELVAEIASRLEGIPLAIELAAARLKVLSLADLTAALDDRLPLLESRSATTTPRQQTLRQTIEWSCDLLSPGALELLEVLAVCPSSWTLDYARRLSVATGIEGDVLDLTTELVDKSMITTREQCGSARYSMLDTVRDYLYEALAARRGSGVARSAHCDAMVDLVEQVPSRTLPFKAMAAGWFDRLEVEQANLRAALDWCVRRKPDKPAALRLCAGMRWFWVERGHFEEGLRAINDSLAIQGQPASAELDVAVAHGLLTAALLHWRGGDYTQALKAASQALGIFEARQEQWGEALSLCVLGMVGQLRGDAKAAQRNRASLDIYRALNDDYGTTWQLLLLAQDALRDGDSERAAALAREGLSIARAAQNPFGEGWALAHLAVVSEATGNLAAAAQHMTSAREAVAAEDRWASELMRVALVRICALQGDLDVARHHATESLRGFSVMNSSVEFGTALHAIGLIAHCEGDSVAAARLAGAADNLCPVADVAPVLLGQEAIRRDRHAMTERLGRERFEAEFDIGRNLRAVDVVQLATTIAQRSLQPT